MSSSSDSIIKPLRERDDSGSIGIGAMIVFIALILVAAVASTIIIKTAEELQQNAESTSQDTREQISGKVAIIDVLATVAHDPLHTATNTDISTMRVIARISSGSLNVQEQDLSYYITCQFMYDQAGADTVGAGTAFAVVDAAAIAATTLAGVAYASADEITAGTTFTFLIALTPSDHNNDGVGGVGLDNDDFVSATAAKTSPGCDAAAGAGETLDLRIAVAGGGETLATLGIESLTLGTSLT